MTVLNREEMINLERAEIVRNELKKMKTFDTDEKCSIIENYIMHYLRNVKGYNYNDELIKQLIVLQACMRTERPVPKQLEPLNELKEHLNNNRYEFLDEETVNVFLDEIEKYVVDFPEDIVETMKSNK